MQLYEDHLWKWSMEVKLQNSFLLFISSSSPSGRYQEWKPELIFSTKLNNLKSWLGFFSLLFSLIEFPLVVHDKLFTKYSCEIYTLNLWYNSCKCFGGPGLMESVSFRSCHSWCFCTITAVFAHLGPSCHGLGLCVCLRSLPVSHAGAEYCVMIPWWQIPCLSPQAQGSRGV